MIDDGNEVSHFTVKYHCLNAIIVISGPTVQKKVKGQLIQLP
jgi:hypothetical protein